MRVWILGLLAAVIIIIYAVPTFYSAGTQKQVIKAARTVAQEIIDTRFLSISKASNFGIHFIKQGRMGYTIFADTNNNGTYDAEDKVLKTSYLDEVAPDVVYSSLFDNKHVDLENNTFVFKGVRDAIRNLDKGHDSIFFNDKTNEAKKSVENLVRLYIDKDTYEVKLLRTYEVNEQGDVIFKEF